MWPAPRFKQVTPEGTSLYIAAFGVLAEVTNPGTMSQRWTDYLSVGNAKVGMRTLQSASETLTARSTAFLTKKNCVNYLCPELYEAIFARLECVQAGVER